MSKKRPDGIPEQLLQARMHVLEQALIAFVEDVDGRVPTDPEIEAQGRHVGFSDTPLSVYEKDGHRFQTYFLWRFIHVVAYAFDQEKSPVNLSIVRLKRNDWPPALVAWVGQHKPRQDKPDA